MVEVFITDVNSAAHASELIELIHYKFPECRANFDLQDRDKILRVASPSNVETESICILLEEQGFNAKVLPDVIMA